MKIFSKILCFSLIALIFFGSVGINVFAHFCKQDGISYSYLIPAEHRCEAPKIEIPACCHTEKITCHEESESKQMQSSCCSEQTMYFKISGDFDQFKFQKSSLIASTFIPVQLTERITGHVFASKMPEVYESPPPLYGKEILIRNQVFRI